MNEQVLADIQQNERVTLEINAVHNETDDILKQSTNDCRKTPATENEYTKLENRLVGLVFLFEWHINLRVLSNAKAILLDEEQWCNLIQNLQDPGGGYTFPKGICPKVNVIRRLEIELAYYDSAVWRFNHYTTKTSPVCFVLRRIDTFRVI